MSKNLNIESVKKNRSSLATWDASLQQWKKIPIALSPVKVSKQVWLEIQRDAELIASCFPLLHDWLLKPENKDLHSKIYAGLEGVEAQAASQPSAKHWGHATWRFDLFWDHQTLKVIEANCTIPAMQAYGDMVSEIWQNASTQKLNFCKNTEELLNNLLTLYKTNGGNKKSPKIAILHREQDSQISELNYYKKHWSKHCEVELVTPSQLKVANSQILFKGKPIDIIYRHIFAWRLKDSPDLLVALSNNKTFHIYNPISAHYESKAFLAFLSEAADNITHCTSLNLSVEQISAIKRSIPWTRVVFTEKKHSYWSNVSGKDEFLSEPEKFVLKSSIGYGGHQVLLGEAWNEPSTQLKLKSLLQTDQNVSTTVFWNWLETEAAGTWIIQKKLSGRRHITQILDPSDKIIEINGYVDASVYLTTGSKIKAGGGVSRVAQGPVVNIGAGGGLAPFVIES